MVRSAIPAHSRPMMCGSKSGPAQRAFKSYLSSRRAAENVESSMSSHEFLSILHLIALPLPPPLLRSDGDVCMARHLASDVAFNMINAPVAGSPVMEELCRQGKERCFDRWALLDYSSYDTDNDSNRSVKRKTADWKVSGRICV